MRIPCLSLCFSVLFWVSHSLQALALDAEQIREAMEGVYGPRAAARFQAWRDQLPDMEQLGEQEKLVAVNNFFNKLKFVDDIELWGLQDYWATPIEFLGVRGGDCEDFSIAKYFTLLELGVDPDKLRLFYVEALEYEQFHMVVGYYPKKQGMPMIMDNLDPKVKPASARRDLKPYFSFNGQHVWSMKVMGQGDLVDSADGLTLWVDLQQRYQLRRMNKAKMNLES